MELETDLNQLKEEARQAFECAENLESWNSERVKFLGRKSLLQKFLKGLGGLDSSERPQAGRLINETRKFIEELSETSQKNLQEGLWSNLAQDDRLDITEPPLKLPQGHRHPLTRVQEEVEDIFLSMGFDILDGPEIETEFNNFEALNVPGDHPARDMQDTFWLKGGQVLRTQTSNVQIRAMQTLKPPIRAIAPGRVYRNEEADASHEHTFHQVEGLMVDRDVSAANLIAVIETFLKTLFGQKVNVRLRPGYFPFVEPGFEVDFSCLLCRGKGCKTCHGTGWLEFMGSGLVHPNVLKTCGLDPNEWSGFAFGFGLDRLTMMRYGINDVRFFQGGDLRFLEQF